ncbi:TonB-dependent receptor [Parvularcula sp. ZS-1/3]|uniref:TonB-dependent receptor n=1 Tax=Parvularcula mediterranea TaxID=2732508 RepID=A0A7Y3RJZ8_9PROT|nr:TonB-dependent receptor [Parvularcula mediterranea]NNU15385.1 TonB-dependent receptor [Parvularcula mediterranea]
MTAKELRRSLTLGASLLAAGLATAQAQEERRSTISELTDTIVVTATKSQDPEDVQDVAVAVTAFNENTIDALNVRDLEDLTFSAPNVSLDDIGTARGQANFSIRGLGVNSSIGSIDPAVGVFVDGVYLGINSGVVFDVFDLESIEVLRGPQGILFGRNTTGGAVLLNTGNPTDEFQGKVTYILETPIDDDRGGVNQFIMGTVSGPLVEGKLNGKFSVYFNDDEGYFQNLANGENQGAAETQIIRGALEYMPTENLTFLGKAELFDNYGDGPSAQNRGVFRRDTFDLSIDEPGYIDVEAQTFSLRTDWELNFGTITNITGYRNFTQRTLGDIDSTPAFIFHSPTDTAQDQFSNELRYAGTWGNFDVKGGLFYFDQTIAVTEKRIIPVVPFPDQVGGGTQDQTIWGLFGQVDWNMNEDLTLTGGLRYGYEEKDVAIAYVIPRAVQCDILLGTCPTNDINTTGFEDTDDWSNLSPKLGFEYTGLGDALVYGGWTRAFRSGGYNFRITNPALFAQQVSDRGGKIATDEEKVDSFELGTKIDGIAGRGLINAAVFFTSIEDMQREVNIASATSGVSQFILNTADAEILGLEVETQWALTDSLLLTGNLGLIDAEYTDVRFDISGDQMVDGADEALSIPRVPEMTYGASVIYELDLGNSFVTSRLSYQHRDRFAYTDNNFGWIQPIDNLDLDVTWQTPVEGLSLSVYAENLLDEVQAGGDSQIPFGGPLSDGTNVPFDEFPAAGTLSPLKKGRLVGFEATIAF